jgi:putative NADPH-quinone reductase
MKAAIINVHPLENTATTSLARDDLLAFVERTGHRFRVVDLESDLVDSAKPPCRRPNKAHLKWQQTVSRKDISC